MGVLVWSAHSAARGVVLYVDRGVEKSNLDCSLKKVTLSLSLFGHSRGTIDTQYKARYI